MEPPGGQHHDLAAEPAAVAEEISPFDQVQFQPFHDIVPEKTKTNSSNLIIFDIPYQFEIMIDLLTINKTSIWKEL